MLGTGMYHPILPLIPEKEVRRQIRLNEEINSKVYGRWEKKGFFPPELAINSNVIKIVKEFNYKWIISSGIACPIEWPYDKLYKSPEGITLYFRDDILSNKIAFKHITAKEFVKTIKTMYLNETKDNDRFIITALDGETFGFHIKNYHKSFLKKVIELIQKENDIEIIFISELEYFFPFSNKKIVPKESSWSTMPSDLKNHIPFPLWNNPKNRIHKYYWKMMRSLHNLISLTDKLDKSTNWNIENYCNTARWFYDKSLHSCPLWWANPERHCWSPNLIYKGVILMLKAALNAQLALINSKSMEGEGYYDSILYYHGLLMMEISEMEKNLLINQ
ncbi:MAG: hypothetical protein ACTSUL_07330 [Promethearchaeota archaeon]